MENEGKGEGCGKGGVVGWEEAKEPASQYARICQNYPLAIYPLVCSLNRALVKSEFLRLQDALKISAVSSVSPNKVFTLIC